MGENVAALVACSKNKEASRAVSWKMYDSILFEKSWNAATLLGHPYVMSAKHGLLPVNERIDEYDETLRNYSDDERREWADDVLSSLSDEYDTIVLFGGRDYVDPIIEMNDTYDVRDPYDGTSGNGVQMSIAGEIVEEELGESDEQ